MQTGGERASEGVGEYGQRVPGPPWILGHRGAPREAPENTLASLQRAIDLGLDGVEYDLHACSSGEPVLIHDETLDRTTNAHGPVRNLTLPELAGVDAGGWFAKRFTGEPLPLLQEALLLSGDVASRLPMHMIELKDPSLVGQVARQLAELPRPLPVRIASFEKRVCLEARDLGLATMLLTYAAREEDLALARDERLTALGTAPGGWREVEHGRTLPFERWSWSVDEPADVLAACRAPLFGFNTNEPRRALAARALVHLAPEDTGEYPLHVPPLEVPWASEDTGPGYRGEWAGRWKTAVRVRNPFGYPVTAVLTVAVRGGAFELEGVPAQTRLLPGHEAHLPLSLVGGSWSPGEDPVLLARFAWSRGPGRPEESLQFDHPIARIRTLRVASEALRVPMLRERPGEPYASMRVWTQGRFLMASVESPGGVERPHALVRIGDRIWEGSRAVRAPLAGHGTDGDPRGVPFSVGFRGEGPRGTRHLRRWAGGLPGGLRAGAPGRLLQATQG